MVDGPRELGILRTLIQIAKLRPTHYYTDSWN